MIYNIAINADCYNRAEYPITRNYIVDCDCPKLLDKHKTELLSIARMSFPNRTFKAFIRKVKK